MGVAITNLANGAITKSSTGSTTFSGAFSNAGDLTVGAGTLSLLGAFADYDQATDVLSGGAFHVAGTLRFTGADIVTNRAVIDLIGTPSAIVDTVGNDGFRHLTRNEGTLSIGGGRTLTLPNALTNTGSIVVGSGSTLVLPSLTNDGGSVSGAGTIVGTVTSTGTMQPGTSPGTLTIDGSFTQTAAGTLAIEIGGPAAGTGHDVLAVSGAATLGRDPVPRGVRRVRPDGRVHVRRPRVRLPQRVLRPCPGPGPGGPGPGPLLRRDLRSDERRRERRARRVLGRRRLVDRGRREPQASFTISRNVRRRTSRRRSTGPRAAGRRRRRTTTRVHRAR